MNTKELAHIARKWAGAMRGGDDGPDHHAVQIDPLIRLSQALTYQVQRLTDFKQSLDYRVNHVQNALTTLAEAEKGRQEVLPLGERLEKFKVALHSNVSPSTLRTYRRLPRYASDLRYFLKNAYRAMKASTSARQRRSSYESCIRAAQSSALNVLRDAEAPLDIPESIQHAVQELPNISSPSLEDVRTRVLHNLLRAQRKYGPIVRWEEYREDPNPKRLTAEVIRKIDEEISRHTNNSETLLFLKPFGRVTLEHGHFIKTFGPFMHVLIIPERGGLRDAFPTFWPHHSNRMWEQVRGLWHPHMNQYGNLCMGDANTVAKERIQVGQIQEYLTLAGIAIGIYSLEGGPERHIEEFWTRPTRARCLHCNRMRLQVLHCATCRKGCCTRCNVQEGSRITPCRMCGETYCETCKGLHPCEVRRQARERARAEAEANPPDPAGGDEPVPGIDLTTDQLRERINEVSERLGAGPAAGAERISPLEAGVRAHEAVDRDVSETLERDIAEAAGRDIPPPTARGNEPVVDPPTDAPIDLGDGYTARVISAPAPGSAFAAYTPPEVAENPPAERVSPLDFSGLAVDPEDPPEPEEDYPDDPPEEGDLYDEDDLSDEDDIEDEDELLDERESLNEL